MAVFSAQIDRALTVTKSRRSVVDGTRMSAIIRDARRQRPTNAAIYRAWSIHGPLVRASIDHLKNVCRRAEWELVPFCTDLPAPDKGLIRAQYELLNRPNPEDSSFGEFFERLVEDQLALDAGVIEKERLFRGDLVGLHPTMGEFIKVDSLWIGRPEDAALLLGARSHATVPFLNNNMVYARLHPRTNAGVGIPPLETLKLTIESELNGSMYNARQVTQAAPDGIMDLGENARPDQVDTFKALWNSLIAGKSMMAFWGGTKSAKFIPFKTGNREMQFIEWQEYLVRKLCAVFQISPQDLGFSFDINKSTGQVQQEQTDTRGGFLLSRAQDVMTSQFCLGPVLGRPAPTTSRSASCRSASGRRRPWPRPTS